MEEHFRRRASSPAWRALASLPAQAQTDAEAWPTQPIRLITRLRGGAERLRVRADRRGGVEKRLGQRIVLEAMPQSSGMGGDRARLERRADGHTLLVGTSSQLVFNIALFPDMPVDLAQTCGASR